MPGWRGGGSGDCRGVSDASTPRGGGAPAPRGLRHCSALRRRGRREGGRREARGAAEGRRRGQQRLCSRVQGAAQHGLEARDGGAAGRVVAAVLVHHEGALAPGAEGARGGDGRACTGEKQSRAQGAFAAAADALLPAFRGRGRDRRGGAARRGWLLRQARGEGGDADGGPRRCCRCCCAPGRRSSPCLRLAALPRGARERGAGERLRPSASCGGAAAAAAAAGRGGSGGWGERLGPPPPPLLLPQMQEVVGAVAATGGGGGRGKRRAGL